MLRVVVVLATLVAVTLSASIPRSLIDERIVGGSITDISKHPYHVSLRYKKCDTCAFEHRCGSAIIGSKFILTAAHCVTDTVTKRLHIVAGGNERNGNGVVVPVEKCVYHEDYYKNVAYENDVAVCVLALDLPLNDYSIKKIDLTDGEPKVGATVTVSGWGTTTEGGDFSAVLQEVDVQVVDNDLCNKNYGGTGRINKSMLCAGTSKGGKDACQQDSGGPLIHDRVLVGIVSWGDGCARADKPGVYANISQLKAWIENVIAINS